MPLFQLTVGSVTSVGLAAPASILTVSGSPVTGVGTLTLALATQNANKVWAGPTTGADATPTFRALVTADLPAGTGTVTSVAMTVPSILSVAGSPITTSGTLAVTLVNQSANLVFAGPSTGASAAPTFRSLVAADIPDLSSTYQPLNTKLTNFAALANASGVLTNNGSGTYSWVAAATGTVTSVALTVPSFLSVSGSPVTTSGTLAVTLATQSANTVFAGPTTGSAAAPTFRSLVAADIPDISATYLKKANNLSDVSSKSTSFDNLSPFTTLGDTLYGGTSGTGTRLAGNTTSTRKFMRQTGTGTVSAAPAWDTLVAGDIPDISATYAKTGAATASGLTMSTARLLGRTTASSGAIEEISVGTSLSLSAGSLNTIQGIQTSDTPQFLRIGLGTAATSGSPNAAVNTLVTADDSLVFTMSNDSAGQSANLVARRQRTTSPFEVQDGDRIGQLIFRGYDATSSAFNNVAFLRCELDGAPSGANLQGRLLGIVNTTAGVQQEIWRAITTGLLIGTTSTTGLSGTGNIRASGAFMSGSPSGGTAQPFKIGNVATVTPTSQNRTIEIEINGTTYYLTAKTTNN